MDSQLLELIRNVQSADTNTRKQSEQALEEASSTNVDNYMVTLTEVGQEPNVPTGLKQSALLLLKKSISKSWNIGFSEFQEPPASPAVKQKVRQNLFEMMGSNERKVRSVCALLLAKIASVEFPDEWPDLIDRLVQVIQQGAPVQVHGALTVMKELLRESISEEEFYTYGETVISTLFQVASNENYSWVSRGTAIECFGSCIQFFLMADESQQNMIEAFAEKTIAQWCDMFSVILKQTIKSPGHASLISCKLEILTCIKDMESAFEKFVSVQLVSLFSSVWTDLCELESYYVDYYVGEDTPPIEPYNVEEDEDLLADCTVDTLVVSELEFFVSCLESGNRRVSEEFTHDDQLIRRFVTMFIKLGQFPNDVPMDNINEFVTEETGLSIDHTVRSELANVICLLNNDRLPSALFEQVEMIFKNDNNNGEQQQEEGEASVLLKESCFYLFGQVITGGTRNFPNLEQNIVDDMIKYTFGAIQSSHILLQSRAIILGSFLCTSFENVISDSIKRQYLEEAMRLGLHSPSSVVRAGALIAINKIQSISTENLKPHQEALFSIIASLVDVAADDTPAFLVEVLLFVVRLDFAISARSKEIVGLLFTLASKDTSNIELTTETTSVFEDIVENATQLGMYSEVCANTLPTLSNGLIPSKNWDFNPDMMLSIGLIGALIDKGPTPLPEEVLDHILEPLYNIIMNTTDVQLLQTASETFTYLVSHSSEQLKNWTSNDNKAITGQELMLNVASKLLDPSCEDSSTINSGSLISIIINKFGQELGTLLPRILEATTRRLFVAQNLLLVESLVSVFSQLVHQSPQGVVDILWGIEIDGTRGINIVMEKWLSTFDVLRGYEEIKKNIIALQQLYLLDDERIKSVTVDGDVQNAQDDIIITRSRASEMKYSKVPAHVKIVKLLVKELSTTPFDSEEAKGAVYGLDQHESNNNNDDEEWDDIETLDDSNNHPLLSGLGRDVMSFINDEGLVTNQKHNVDSETHSLIISWFKKITEENISGINSIFHNELTQEEKNILLKFSNLN